MKKSGMFLILALGWVGATTAGGDVARGKEKSAACAACHGADGNSPMPLFPKLSGQHADYLLHSLKAYKSGSRKDPIMAGQVANLSQEDMENLAAYYASQQGLTVK